MPGKREKKEKNVTRYNNVEKIWPVNILMDIFQFDVTLEQGWNFKQWHRTEIGALQGEARDKNTNEKVKKKKRKIEVEE